MILSTDYLLQKMSQKERRYDKLEKQSSYLNTQCVTAFFPLKVDGAHVLVLGGAARLWIGGWKRGRLLGLELDVRSRFSSL